MKPIIIKCFIICLVALTLIAAISVLIFAMIKDASHSNHHLFTTPLIMWIIFIVMVGLAGALWACCITLADDATMDEGEELEDLETDVIPRDQTEEQVV